MKNVQKDKMANLVRWASDLGRKYGVDTPTILMQFRRLKNAGASIEQAKENIEEIYAS